MAAAAERPEALRGGIALRADCNRGAGVVAFPEPGAVRMGPLALTRAMCPPDSLSDRFARDVERAVRWTVRDGHLHLELPEASGILWFTRRTDGPFRGIVKLAAGRLAEAAQDG